MATYSPFVSTAGRSSLRSLVRPRIERIKRFFGPTTMPDPMSEQDIQKYLYPVHPLVGWQELRERQERSGQ